MQMVGLGRGEQDAVDARAGRASTASTRGRRGTRCSTSASARSRSRSAAGPEFSARERVDQHDLPVEPAEMIAEERPHDMGLVGLVAARHHRAERARGGLGVLADRQRREGQRRRALEIARHQEAARRQRRQRIDLLARLAQIGGEQCRRRAAPRPRRRARRDRARRASRASRRRAARAPGSRSPPASRATIAHSSFPAAAGRAAIRRDSRRCRASARPADAPAARALEFEPSAAAARCAGSTAASGARRRVSAAR